MSFKSGSIGWLRFKGLKVDAFTQDHLDRLEDRKAGRQRLASGDGIDVGWSGGDHILDAAFDLEKNIVNDALLFDLRVTSDKLPGDLLRAYYQVELKALAKGNPSGFASAKQKREAKESARERLEDEAKDGRFKKHRSIPVMWDGRTGSVLFGSPSVSMVDRFCSLFEQTFTIGLECQTAGARLDAVELSPTEFYPGYGVDIAWIASNENMDFLGNEFLLWLWYFTDVHSDTLGLCDNTELTFMFAKSLKLDCPRGQTGVDTMRHEGPTRLPESIRAIQSGKMPRKVGMTIVRNVTQYSFAIAAESMALSMVKLPAPEEDITEARAKMERRIDFVRDLEENIDLMYARFLDARLDAAKWAVECKGIKRWLGK